MGDGDAATEAIGIPASAGTGAIEDVGMRDRIPGRVAGDTTLKAEAGRGLKAQAEEEVMKALAIEAEAGRVGMAREEGEEIEAVFMEEEAGRVRRRGLEDRVHPQLRLHPAVQEEWQPLVHIHLCRHTPAETREGLRGQQQEAGAAQADEQLAPLPSRHGPQVLRRRPFDL